MLVKDKHRWNKYRKPESKFHRWVRLAFDRLGISRYINLERPIEFPATPFPNTPKTILFYMDFVYSPKKKYGGLIKKNVSKEKHKTIT